jgi:hypothetical protein
MNRSAILVLSLGMLLPAAAGAAAKTGEAVKVFKIDGTVQSVDLKKFVVSVKSEDGKVVAARAVYRRTKIIRGKKENVFPSSLKPGTKVRMEYKVEGDGTNRAIWILFNPYKPSGTAKPKP